VFCSAGGCSIGGSGRGLFGLVSRGGGGRLGLIVGTGEDSRNMPSGVSLPVSPTLVPRCLLAVLEMNAPRLVLRLCPLSSVGPRVRLCADELLRDMLPVLPDISST
jgi:hypothetical protein